MSSTLTSQLSTNHPTRPTNIYSSQTPLPNRTHWNNWYCPSYPSYIILSKNIWPKQHHSTSLWSSFNFRAIYSPAFIKPLIFYKFNSIIQPIIKQASDIISISEKYTAQHESSLLSSINFRTLSRPAFNKPLIFYQFQSKIHPSIHQASDLLSISEHYPVQH